MSPALAVDEVLGGEARHRRVLDRLADVDGVADAQRLGVDQADDVAGLRGLDRLRCRGRRPTGRTSWRTGLPVDAWVTTMPRSKLAGHHPGVGEPVAVGVVHARLHLEDEGAEVVVDLAHRAVHALGGARGRARCRAAGRAAGATPKFCSAEANMTGVVSPARKRSWSWSASSSVSSSCSSTASAHGGASTSSTSSGPIRRSGARVAPPAVRVYFTNSPVRRSSTPRKSPASPTGQVSGVGPQPDLLLDEVHQLQRGQAGTVPLVDDRHHRDAAQRADLEELERLRLEPLAGVDQHHGGVDRGEHPVGVLGEVAVAGGVDEVDRRGRGRRTAAPRR